MLLGALRKQRRLNHKPLVAIHRHTLRPFRKERMEVDGWCINLNVMREQPRANGKVVYVAVLTTGEEEVGTHIAVMDREFEFDVQNVGVMRTIRASIKADNAIKRLLEDAVESLRELQKTAVHGPLLPN